VGEGGSLQAFALAHDRLREEDEARSAYLSDLIKNKGWCRYCGATLGDEVLARTPGCCAKRACRKLARDHIIGKKAVTLVLGRTKARKGRVASDPCS
jgi:hypothetical protein